MAGPSDAARSLRRERAWPAQRRRTSPRRRRGDGAGSAIYQAVAVELAAAPLLGRAHAVVAESPGSDRSARARMGPRACRERPLRPRVVDSRGRLSQPCHSWSASRAWWRPWGAPSRWRRRPRRRSSAGRSTAPPAPSLASDPERCAWRPSACRPSRSPDAGGAPTPTPLQRALWAGAGWWTARTVAPAELRLIRFGGQGRPMHVGACRSRPAAGQGALGCPGGCDRSLCSSPRRGSGNRNASRPRGESRAPGRRAASWQTEVVLPELVISEAETRRAHPGNRRNRSRVGGRAE